MRFGVVAAVAVIVAATPVAAATIDFEQFAIGSPAPAVTTTFDGSAFRPVVFETGSIASFNGSNALRVDAEPSTSGQTPTTLLFRTNRSPINDNLEYSPVVTSFEVTFDQDTLLYINGFDPSTGAGFRNIEAGSTFFFSGLLGGGSDITSVSFFGEGTAYVDNITFADATNFVPEPATWAMMIAGFGMVGGALRRRGAMQTGHRLHLTHLG